MNNRNDRSERLRRRLDDEPTDDTDTNDEREPDQEGTGSEPDETSDVASDSPGVKERRGVLMYLPDDVRQELDARFDELNAQYKREHGEALEKNRHWYPAVVKAGLDGEDVEDILDI